MGQLQPGYGSVFREGLFEGQTIVVTGGGSGIGRCTAHELASLGAHVVLVGRRREKLETAAAEIAQAGGSVSTEVCDIRDEATVAESVRRIFAARRRIHGLVNNAGGQFPSTLTGISQKGFETVVRTNLVGGFLFSREVVTQCMEANGGAIVNIVADMWRGMPGMGHSGAARAGMVNLTQTASVEWAQFGVRVNAVAPGWIASSGFDHYDGAVRALLPRLRECVPLKRIGTEAEVSAAIVFLLSEAAAFVSGATLRVDGAASLAGLLYPLAEHDRSKSYNGFPLAALPEALKPEPPKR